MKKVLKITWRLLPWYLAIRGMYIYMGMVFNRVRCKSDMNSTWELIGKEDFNSSLARIHEASDSIYSRVHSGWKWYLSKE